MASTTQRPEDEADIPSIDAIFVVRFDTRQGNQLEWSQAATGIELQGIEFTALPSGLHTRQNDVIYFQLDGCIGISVFVNERTENEATRGANMVSVGVLVRPSAETGRCGQVWRHLEFLQSEASHHTEVGADTSKLEEYFTRHRSITVSKRNSYRARNRRRISRSFTISEPAQPQNLMSPGLEEAIDADEIPKSHPSLHFLELVHTMGPAIFILWKAALLRKRILIYTPPPVESTCLAVYNICLMATIPSGTATLAAGRSIDRVQPLFCVGINDIEYIEALQGGYVACTTDKLFAFKPQLYDVLVDLSAPSIKVQYSTLKLPHPNVRQSTLVQGVPTLEETMAVAMDNRRYFSLLQQLARFRRRQGTLQKRLCAESALESPTPVEDPPDVLKLHHEDTMKGLGLDMAGTLRVMMTGGWWWWYGSEAVDEEECEPFLQGQAEQDQSDGDTRDQRLGGACLQVLQMQTNGNVDTEAIRFFHHLTKTVLSGLGRLLSFKATAAIFDEGSESGTGSDAASTGQSIVLTREDIRQLGLDASKDGAFVEELSRVYFDTEVEVRGWDLGTCCLSLTSCGLCR